MVKVTTPIEIAEPIAWLMGRDSGMEPLFSGLVPYGVHLALSKLYPNSGSDQKLTLGIYDDRKDNVVRELDGKREELDGVAASTLQSLNLPGSIQALERPAGLPPSLLKKAEEVDSAGGTARIEHLLSEAHRLSQSNARALSEVSFPSDIATYLTAGNGYSGPRSDREREPFGTSATIGSKSTSIACRQCSPDQHIKCIR